MSVIKQAVTNYVYENVKRWRKDIRLADDRRITVLLPTSVRKFVDEGCLDEYGIDFMWMIEPFDGMLLFPQSLEQLAELQGINYLPPGAYLQGPS